MDESKITYRWVIENLYAHETEAQGREARRALRDAVQYDDLMRSITFHPEHDIYVDRFLDKYMGYHPVPPARVKHGPDIRYEVEQYLKRKIDYNTFVQNSIAHAKKMRSIDMKYGNWILHKTIRKADMDHYMTYLAPFRDQARERLAKRLKYYPDLLYSLPAEMFLREFLADDTFNPAWVDHPADFKAMDITIYREALITVGQEYADKFPLMACQDHIKIFDIKIFAKPT